MKWIFVCALVVMAVPVYAGSKTPKTVQKQNVAAKEPVIQCINGVEEFNAMLSINPYDNVDRCFRYDVGQNIQLLDRTHALYGLYTDRKPFALIDFGDKSAPNLFGGVVRGKGAYSFVTNNGNQMIINSFVVMTSSDLEKAREIKNENAKRKAVAEEAAELKRLGPEGIRIRDEERKRIVEEQQRQAKEQKEIEENKRMLEKERLDKVQAELKKQEIAARQQKEARRKERIEQEEIKQKKCLEDGAPCKMLEEFQVKEE